MFGPEVFDGVGDALRGRRPLCLSRGCGICNRGNLHRGHAICTLAVHSYTYMVRLNLNVVFYLPPAR